MSRQPGQRLQFHTTKLKEERRREKVLDVGTDLRGRFWTLGKKRIMSGFLRLWPTLILTDKWLEFFNFFLTFQFEFH